ncbi:MAG: ACGX-repeat peptide [Lachnospiraceae bacterium]|nr:ACGX-repeat peptide [Lachnospiraceae bacterium]
MKEVTIMSNLKNVAAFAATSCGSACGAADPKPEEKPATSCGSACGAADPKPEEKPASACGSACGAGDPESK